MQKSAVIEYNHDGYQCEGFAVWDDAGAKSARHPGVSRMGRRWRVHAKARPNARRAWLQCVRGRRLWQRHPPEYALRLRSGDDEICNQPAIASTAGTLRLDELRKVPKTDLGRMAAIGYCFGGMTVLEMARDGQNDLAGVVSFHGVLATPTPLKPNTYKGKILVLHGVDDPVVPGRSDDGVLEGDARCQGELGVRRLRESAPHLHQLADAGGRPATGCLQQTG